MHYYGFYITNYIKSVFCGNKNNRAWFRTQKLNCK